MFSIKKILVGFLLLIILSTCTKFGKNVYVDGYVRNAITGEPVPNVSFRLYRGQISWGDPVGTDSKTLKTVTTNEQGYFKVEYLSTPFNQVYLQIGGGVEGGYVLVDGNETQTIKKGKRNHFDYQMVPYGNLILDIQNVNCGGSGDIMYFRKKWLGYTDFEGSYSTPRTGCYSYTSPSSFQVPMGTYVFEMKVIRSSITSYVYDTIVVPETGVVTINMEY
jgi:hypothetical protein